MNANDKSKRALAIAGSALALAGIGGGLAVAAGNSSQPSTQPTTAPSPQTAPQTGATDTPTPGDKADVTPKDAATPGDKADTGTDRETPDAPGTEGVENPAAETENEASEPAGGHEDSGPNVDHQFEGIE